MNNKKIKIRIYPNGEIDAYTEGIKGKECLKYADILEEILNAKIVDSELLNEYYEDKEFEYEEEYNYEKV
ncbi:DUF2997 domain-containing protein [Clostridium perfringens]|uniref:DUF2997 domain-containing protein n=1 Tax=Clostridium perfringens TaxID=1502 RepID=UPI000F8F768B|nr:DUF2997 domain-containing protein [Clostridium perfringens]RUR41828.1 DUF2997 domain-containing protein [Clostridium perfringens]